MVINNKQDMIKAIELVKESNSDILKSIIKICESQININEIYESWIDSNDTEK